MSPPPLEVRIAARRGSFRLDVALSVRGPLVVAGPNGAGKTTLLRAIAGLVPADEARIVLGKTTLADTAAGVDLPPEARGVGYVPQGFALFPHLSVEDNVAFGLAGPRPRRRAAARSILADLDAADLAGRRVATLSGGEAQKVALARALAARPRLLLLDEPLAALDAAARRSVRARLAAWIGRWDLSTFVVTHDLRDAMAFGGVCAVLEGGRLVQHGTLSDLARAPATDFVAEFVAPLAGEAGTTTLPRHGPNSMGGPHS